MKAQIMLTQNALIYEFLTLSSVPSVRTWKCDTACTVCLYSHWSCKLAAILYTIRCVPWHIIQTGMPA